MFDYLALFQEYLTVELGLAKNTQMAYMRDLRLLMKSLQLKADEELLQVSSRKAALPRRWHASWLRLRRFTVF